MIPAIVLLGNLLVDDVVFADGTTRMAQPGGALLYGALAATAWGARPGLVSVLGDDYPARVIENLRQRGVDLAGVHPLGRAGVRTWVLYEGRVRRLIHRVGCPTHEEVSPGPALIPAEWASAGAFHLAPMPFEVQRVLLAALRECQATFVSIDPHQPVTEETLPGWREALADADAFLAGEDELLLEGAAVNPGRALSRLVSGRLRFVVFKRGASGGIVYDAHAERFYSWDARADAVVDETGAGDAFGVGFVLAHLEGLPVEACLHRAVVTASFALGGWGPDALFAAARAHAEARLREWYGGGARR
ncbi:MAG TPA: carbohydrate kinase family protein [Vicinamibacterales bacterium]|nr:carbohydrate kinase family protein [Vicinamibacterales bacterium]